MIIISNSYPIFVTPIVEKLLVVGVIVLRILLVINQ